MTSKHPFVHWALICVGFGTNFYSILNLGPEDENAQILSEKTGLSTTEAIDRVREWIEAHDTVSF